MNSLISRRLALFLLALSVCICACTRRGQTPQFSGTTIDREAFDSNSLRGKVVLIEFWTTWCGACRSDQTAVQELRHEFADQGFVVIAVNMGESRETVENYLRDSPRYDQVVLAEDTDLPKKLFRSSLPHYVVIDREGKVTDEQQGAGGKDALKRLLKGSGLTS